MGNPPIREQARFAEQLYLLIFFFVFFCGRIFGIVALCRLLALLLIVVELGMGDLMDGGGNGLHLAHALPDGDALFVEAEIPVHILLRWA